MELSEWIVIDGCGATRVIKGTDPNKVSNRVAFIEKTPRVFNGKDWICGPKGRGGGFGEDHEDLGQYGFYKPSRDWCDSKLREFGFTF